MIYAKSSVVTFRLKTINGAKQRDFVFPPEGAGAYTKRGVFPCPQWGFTGFFFLDTLKSWQTQKTKFRVPEN